MRSTRQVDDIRRNIAVCRLTCGNGSTLWPLPTGDIILGDRVVSFNTKNMKVQEFVAPDGYLRSMTLKAVDLMKENLKNLDQDTNELITHRTEVRLRISISSADNKPRFGTDESYVLYVRHLENKGIVYVRIWSSTFFGTRHALETLSQLIVYDDDEQCLQIISFARISDKPMFQHRGLFLDTGRAFLSVDSLKRTIDAMSYNKLNTFHWHITDSQSFPFYSQSFPQLTQYGSLSADKVYTPDDIKSVVEYGRVRGVRIVPEFDAPAHVGEGWQWFEEEGHQRRTILCFKTGSNSWQESCEHPSSGYLNPINDHVYEVLEGIYRDMLNVFDSDIFYMGGDDVNFNCWNSSRKVLHWMKKHKVFIDREGFWNLWGEFEKRALEKFTTAVDSVKDSEDKPKVALRITNPQESLRNLQSKDFYVLHLWMNSNDTVEEDLLSDYGVVVTNLQAWDFSPRQISIETNYFNECISNNVTWKKAYEFNPQKQFQKEVFVVGGEAVLWSSAVDDATLDAILWPKVSSIAERLWTNSGSPQDWKQVERRLAFHRQRMTKLGIQADVIQSEWCLKNELFC